MVGNKVAIKYFGTLGLSRFSGKKLPIGLLTVFSLLEYMQVQVQAAKRDDAPEERKAEEQAAMTRHAARMAMGADRRIHRPWLRPVEMKGARAR